ncbi:hypothetical protein Tco_0058053 [Tanacetum coccineum]
MPSTIDEFNLKDETSSSEYDEVEQNVLYFNDLFPFNIIYPDNLKSDKENDDNEIDMIQSLGGNENTQWLNKLLEASHDKINKVFIMKSFVMELNVNIVAWNYLVNGMLFNLIKNLYVPFGIPFEPKLYYKDGDFTRMLRRPRFPKGAEDAPDVDEGAQAVPTPIHAPHHHHQMQGRFSTWMVSCMTQLIEASESTYQAFDGTFRGSYPSVFERRTRRRTDGASTSAAPQQPDP